MPTPTAGAKIVEFSQSLWHRLTGSSSGSMPTALAKPPTLVPADGNDTTPGAPVPVGSQVAIQAFDPPDGYFPSGSPINPQAPPGSTTARQWDYPSFLNLTYTPRGEQGANAIGFPTLRHMAEPAEGGLDLLRLAIETRKDQMAAQPWQIRGAMKDDDGGPDARRVEEWLQRPDGVHTFRQWMRMVLEDHFVIDAPAVYVSSAGDRPLWEPMDGATLKVLILADSGRTPLPPLPAYQQIIKGIPAENYTIDQIGYYPYNVRTDRLYGQSRVEQVLATIAIALNRQMSQLQYFTAGTMPDGFMELPKEWSLEAIREFTEWFNSEMSGQLGERRKVRFVPADAKYVPTKPELLKDEFDEWLVRIICYAFSLSPQAFVKQMNRATADTQKESALEEGLEPTKLWFADVMDDLFRRSGYPNLRWQWADEEIVDPEAKAKVVQTYYGGATGQAARIITLDEARKLAGLSPATDAQRAELVGAATGTDTGTGTAAAGKPAAGKPGAPGAAGTTGTDDTQPPPSKPEAAAANGNGNGNGKGHAAKIATVPVTRWSGGVTRTFGGYGRRN